MTQARARSTVQYWEKLGHLFDPTAAAQHPKLASHAANPLALHLEGDVYRVFYSGRDALKRSSVGGVDIDLKTREIVGTHAAPFFTHGPAGSFYADGVSIGNCYSVGSETYMLFMAWQVSGHEHWRGEIGRLRLTAQMGLELANNTPFMALSTADPISLSYPWVRQVPQGGYEMWYGSTLRWDAGNGEMEHVLNHATSNDGQIWQTKGQQVPSLIGVAQAFSRPTVAAHPDGGLEMWFSYRGKPNKSYRIGYARSENGRDWRLALDMAGIDVSPRGWDSQMLEYPFVLDHAGERYMLYNGNGYGESGFGLAVLRRD